MRILSPLVPPRSEATDADSNEGESTKTPGISLNSAVPTVLLDIDVVSDNMAARLCISFLGHVLFLKNQVPFPIIQLAKMPTADNTTRGAKKRHELLNSFDTLASHLYTTFIALSTALALRGSPDVAESEALRQHGMARAFLTVALGPTVGTAKSRVIVGIDGLETKVWGLREATVPDNETQIGEDEGDANPSDDESNTDDEDERSEDEESGVSGEDDLYGSDDDPSPPPSRSPSPSHSSDSEASQSTTPLDVKSPSPLQTEDPETVRAAERLLSRTLANACAEDDDHGLASEMAPTQIHVLLRAPRRFNHPSWVPRQNLCSSLDGYLADFLVESGEPPIASHVVPKQRTKASKVQGVWVKSRESSTQIKCCEENLAEEDELIWWCWDGKLVGFTDW